MKELLTSVKCGLMGLLSDSNFYFALLCLLVLSVLSWFHRIGDVAFAGSFGSISSVYCWQAGKLDISELLNRVLHRDVNSAKYNNITPQ